MKRTFVNFFGLCVFVLCSYAQAAETLKLRCVESVNVFTSDPVSTCRQSCSWNYTGPAGDDELKLIGGRSYTVSISISYNPSTILPLCAVNNIEPTNLGLISSSAEWNESSKTLTLPEDISGTLVWAVSGSGPNAPVGPSSTKVISGMLDADNDGVLNRDDQLPWNPLETTDTDGDTFGDNADAFPLVPAEKITFKSEVDSIYGEVIYTMYGPDFFEPGKSYYYCGDPEWSEDLPLEYDADICQFTIPYTIQQSPSSRSPSFRVLVREILNCDRYDCWYEQFYKNINYSNNPDLDDDGVPNAEDVFIVDPLEWLDSDNDGFGDNSDAFPFDRLESVDSDGDGIGDNSDPFPSMADGDADSVLDIDDNCVAVRNPGQSDNDNDGLGNACDPDVDGDGVDDALDSHPLNPVYFSDFDRDRLNAHEDNCPFVKNGTQTDTDGDGFGNACDADLDNDGFEDAIDSHPSNASLFTDFDRDAVNSHEDNCPFLKNPGQSDNDNDGLGNACDPDVDGDGVDDTSDNYPLNPNLW